MSFAQINILIKLSTKKKKNNRLINEEKIKLTENCIDARSSKVID